MANEKLQVADPDDGDGKFPIEDKYCPGCILESSNPMDVVHINYKFWGYGCPRCNRLYNKDDPVLD